MQGRPQHEASLLIQIDWAGQGCTITTASVPSLYHHLEGPLLLICIYLLYSRRTERAKAKRNTRKANSNRTRKSAYPGR
jgi:hypothetical protein